MRKIKRDDQDTNCEALKKRDRIQKLFWNQVGAVEHINLPKLEDAIRKEFKTEDDRAVRAQVRHMQTERRIRIQNKVKVWINEPGIRVI